VSSSAQIGWTGWIAIAITMLGIVVIIAKGMAC
jgi:hypothetical protein